jgi:anaerobic magnesium-protoporphyrin IX monomethyl ester cyclase
MDKVVLIDPRGWQGAVNGYRPSPNVGIAYLVPMLRKHGYEVLVIDLNNEAITDYQVLRAIDDFCPDIIGFSVKTATMQDARNLAQQIKDLLPKMSIVVGGPHTKLAWRELVTEPWFDVIFVGEGEQVLPTICKRLAANESTEDLPGVATRCNFKNFKDGFRLNRPLVAAADLNILPFPEYDIFPKNVRESIRKSYPLVTSRGCVYSCTYCSVPEISGKGFRKRSPQSIIEELRWAKQKYGTTHFEIIDDVFNLDIKRCKEICHALIEGDLGMTWSCPNGLRADRIDQELAELMFQSGCQSVNVGVESADPKILASVKKGETIEDIERGIRTFQEAGISVNGYFIIGLPGDSFKTQERSVEFVKRTGIGALFNILVPYPGTELWDWAKTNARFLENIEGGMHFADSSEKIKIIFETDDFPAKERRMAYEMVHTQLKQFGMLIPQNIPRWQQYRLILRLLWNHDRVQLPSYVFQAFVRKCRQVARQWLKPVLLTLNKVKDLIR